MKRSIALLLPAILILIMMCSCNTSQTKSVSPKIEINKDNIMNDSFVTSVGDDLYYWYPKDDDKSVNQLIRQNKKTKENKILATLKSNGYLNSIFAVDTKTLCIGHLILADQKETDTVSYGSSYFLYDIPAGNMKPLFDINKFPMGIKLKNHINNKYYFSYVNPDTFSNHDVDLTYDLYSIDANSNIEKILSDVDCCVVDFDGIYYSKATKVFKKDLNSETEKQVCSLPDEPRLFNRSFNKYKNKIIYETMNCLHIYDTYKNTETKVISHDENSIVFFSVDSLSFDDKYIYSQSRNGGRIEEISYDGKYRKVIYDGHIEDLGIVDNKVYFSNYEYPGIRLYYVNKDGTDFERLRLD